MESIKEIVNSYNGVVDIKKEFEEDSLALNHELVITLCDQIISFYKLEHGTSSEEEKMKIRTKGKKKFSIVSGGSPFTTNVYYNGEKLPYVKKVIISVDAEDPALRAEVVLNSDCSDCDLEVDFENMIINFGNEHFKLVPIKGK